MFKNLANQIKQYFGFSNSEAKGFIVMIFLLFAFIIAPFIFHYLNDQKDAKSSNDTAKLDSLQAILLQKIDSSKRNSPYKKYKNYRYENGKYSTSKNNNTPQKLFSFDPNKLDANGFKSLGLPSFLAERILNYKKAGGKFYKKQDLQKIYGLRPETYKKLEAFIEIEQKEIAKTAINITENKPSSESKLTSYPTELPSKYPKKQPKPFDLNKADTTILMNLQGIGSKLSARIVNYRDKLGGFYSENQIREVFGLDSAVVLEVQKYGSINSPIYKKIEINEVSELRHLYIKPYIAKAIINYRIQHGKFNSASDLTSIKILDASTLEKVKPYLKF